MSDVTVFSDVVCHLGEGPSAHPALGRVFWFDILEKRLLEKRFDGSGTTVHQLPFHGTVMAVVDDARQLLVGDDGLYLRDVATGAVTLHRAHEADRPDRRSNDGRVHPSGALWFSTMRWTFEDGEGEIWWYRDGEIRRIVTGLSIPNAIAFSADGTHATYSCSKAGTIWRIPTDPATGLPAGDAAVFVKGGDGGPDGAVMDADGLLWNARWGASALHAYDRDGRLVRTVAMPAKQCSCPAFVGPAADRLLVTSAQEGMDPAARAADPLAGQTFLLDLPVRGRFDPPVRLGAG
jgi:sugar lactone lactonase YvrE